MAQTPLSPYRAALSHAAWMIQALLSIILVLIAIIFTVTELRKIGVSGLPAILLYVNIAASIAIAIAHLPTIFFRLSRKGKVAAYIAFLPIAVLSDVYHAKMDPVWDATPKGKIEAENRQAEASAQRSRAAMDAEIERQKTGVRSSPAPYPAEDRQDKVKGCFSWGGKVPDLVSQVEGRIHNPRSFEYISTEQLSDPIGDVAMTFRAENEYGALRRYKAYGVMRDNSDCSFILVSIQED